MIVFGVGDRPHKLFGIENFDSVNDAQIADFFNEVFSPTIGFMRASFVVGGKVLGVIQILESRHKPVVCIKDTVKTFDSDIYCRYSVRSSRMKSGDVLCLIQDVRQQEQDKWIKLLRSIAHVGMDNIAILNSISGELATDRNTFLLDAALLDKIKVLDQYSESKSGAPAVRIVGDVVDVAHVVERQKNIFEEDIFKAFLTEQLFADGMEYISAVLHMNSEIYPVYFFLNASGIDAVRRVEAVESVATRFRSKKKKVVARFVDDSKLEGKGRKYSLAGTKLADERKRYFDCFVHGNLVEWESERECKLALESVFKLKAGEFDVGFVKESLLAMFDEFYPFQGDDVNFNFRWALACLDNICEK